MFAPDTNGKAWMASKLQAQLAFRHPGFTIGVREARRHYVWHLFALQPGGCPYCWDVISRFSFSVACIESSPKRNTYLVLFRPSRRQHLGWN